MGKGFTQDVLYVKWPGLFLSRHLLNAGLHCWRAFNRRAGRFGRSRICGGHLRKKTSRGRHGPLRPSGLTLEGITERALPQHGLDQNLQRTREQRPLRDSTPLSNTRQ